MNRVYPPSGAQKPPLSQVVPATDGTFDLGNIYSGGSRDLTLTYVDGSGLLSFGGAVTYGGVPEPTCLALAGVVAALLLM